MYQRRTQRQAFLSTPSARRATPHQMECGQHPPISIHALREEGDLRVLACTALFSISIHALREEGDIAAGLKTVFFGISIHALREEGDAKTIRGRGHRLRFLSTPSARRATTRYCRHSTSNTNFYPRPPRGGRLVCSDRRVASQRFLSTPSARRATFPCQSDTAPF